MTKMEKRGRLGSWNLGGKTGGWGWLCRVGLVWCWGSRNLNEGGTYEKFGEKCWGGRKLVKTRGRSTVAVISNKQTR